MRLFVALLPLGFVITACATSTTTFPDDDGGAPPADGGSGCSTFCNNVCVDTRTDGKNCGKCGVACPMGATCVQGSCQCGAGQTKCGDTCVDVKVDDANCGKCGQKCGADGGTIMGGGTWKCTNGACTIVCPMPKVECSGACVDTQTDNDNCGMCGNACNPQTEQCSAGQCCKTGEMVCNMKCTNVQSDTQNCGMCGKVCPMNQPACINGNCTTAPCSTVATNYCTGMGWKVVPWSTSWPNQPGGSIFCTVDGRSAANDCDGCGTYRQIIWKSSAKDACQSPMQLQVGNVYGGHNPCSCQANNVLCGQWPMGGCTPD